MVDVDTFLTTLYVTVDEYASEYARTRPAPAPAPHGRRASLSPSEVVTLALFGQWAPFPSERAFYRYAERHLRGAFPRLPTRGQYNRQYNRLLRRQWGLLVGRLRHLADGLGAATCLYQVVDTTGIPTRHAQRRGVGWLPEYTPAVGYCNRVGWYCGFRLLTLATDAGAVTGFALAEAERNDRVLAEDAFAARALPQPAAAQVGAWYGGPYVADAGFEAQARQAHWAADLDALVVCMPNRAAPDPAKRGAPAYRRWLAGVRQIAETVHARLMDSFGLARDRPHAYDGFFARLTAKLALHDFCCWLNQQVHRPTLAFADLIDW